MCVHFNIETKSVGCVLNRSKCLLSTLITRKKKKHNFFFFGLLTQFTIIRQYSTVLYMSCGFGKETELLSHQNNVSLFMLKQN